ncbi:MAG: hypothetical protein NTU83_13770, partial [Candidatus Hydrogenedentes bacterium]|nr:hypothetical protein [Candidatus Hydrogenedentota bacterium]
MKDETGGHVNSTSIEKEVRIQESEFRMFRTPGLRRDSFEAARHPQDGPLTLSCDGAPRWYSEFRILNSVFLLPFFGLLMFLCAALFWA